MRMSEPGAEARGFGLTGFQHLDQRTGFAVTLAEEEEVKGVLLGKNGQVCLCSAGCEARGNPGEGAGADFCPNVGG